jgi:hypothetical protein
MKEKKNKLVGKKRTIKILESSAAMLKEVAAARGEYEYIVIEELLSEEGVRLFNEANKRDAV